MVLFLLLVVVAVVLGIVGAVVHGLGYLLAIGCVLLVADVAFAAVLVPADRPAPHPVTAADRLVSGPVAPSGTMSA